MSIIRQAMRFNVSSGDIRRLTEGCERGFFSKKDRQTIDFSLKTYLPKGYGPTQFKNGNDYANFIYSNPKDPQTFEFIDKTWSGIKNAMTDEAFRPGNGPMKMFTRGDVRYFGAESAHYKLMAAALECKDFEKLTHGDLISYMMLKSFPQQTLFLTPEWAARLQHPGVTDMDDEVRKHQDQIEADFVTYRANGGSIELCGVRFGDGSYVNVSSLVQRWVDGVLQVNMIVGTLGKHPLKGINLWGWRWDPANPHVIVFSNWLIGAHPIPFMDLGNNVFGEGLMGTMYQTVRESIKAELSGEKDLAKYLRENNRPLYLDRALYNLLDRGASFAIKLQGKKQLDFAAEYKVIYGPGGMQKVLDAVEKNPDNIVSSLEGPIKQMEQPGTYVGEVKVDASLFLTGEDASSHDSSSLTEAQDKLVRDAVINRCRYRMSQQDLDDVRESFLDIIKKDLQAQPKTQPEEVYATAMSDPETAVTVRTTLSAKLTEDAVTTLIDELRADAAFAGANPEALVAAIRTAASSQVIEELLRPGGLAQTWTAAEVTSRFFGGADGPPRAEALLREVQAQAVDRKAELEAVRQEIAGAGHDAKKVEVLREKEAQAQEALDEVEKKVKSAGEFAEGAKDPKKLGEGIKKEYDEKAREFRGKKK